MDCGDGGNKRNKLTLFPIGHMFYIHFNVDENVGGWMGVCRGRGLT
jgi:hypothetical protein